MQSQETSNPYPESQGLCIVADGALGSWGESEAPVKHQIVGTAHFLWEQAEHEGKDVYIANSCQGNSTDGEVL